MDKNNILQLMGITAWHLRGRHIVTDKFFRVVFNNVDGKSVGLLLADMNDTITLTDQENLLQKMAEALTPNFYRDIISAAPDDIQGKNYAFIILLGNKINLSPLDCRIIKSFSLSDLMQHSEYKKQLWSDIKSLREFFT